jgi:hypothetical protein
VSDSAWHTREIDKQIISRNRSRHRKHAAQFEKRARSHIGAAACKARQLSCAASSVERCGCEMPEPQALRALHFQNASG